MMKKRNMVDAEESEDDITDEEFVDDEEETDIGKKPLPRSPDKIVKQIVNEESEKQQPKTQIVEREINLSLLNDKLNYIISLLSSK